RRRCRIPRALRAESRVPAVSSSWTTRRARAATTLDAQARCRLAPAGLAGAQAIPSPSIQKRHMHFSFPKIGRRSLVAACALACLPQLHAQTAQFPTRTVRIIVGFPAGTGPDIVARLLAQKLSENWGNAPVVVDNKPGAGGLIAASEAARAAPDGYTLMLAETGQLSIAPSSYNALHYDPARDFAPVSHVVSADF